MCIRDSRYNCVLRVHDGSLRSTGPRSTQEQDRECHRGGRVSIPLATLRSNAGRLDAAFPFGMAVKALPGAEPLLAPSGQSLYIRLRGRGNPPTGKIDKTSMLNDVYN